jgi:putative FmdB family regulatory protein
MRFLEASMPIYEYKCENGHVFDVLQRLSDDPVTDCTVCGAPVKKVLHPVGISFKGSGFYSTDYDKKGPKGEPKEAAATSGDSSNGASDSGAKAKKSEKASTEKSTKKED